MNYIQVSAVRQWGAKSFTSAQAIGAAARNACRTRRCTPRARSPNPPRKANKQTFALRRCAVFLAYLHELGQQNRTTRISLWCELKGNQLALLCILTQDA